MAAMAGFMSKCKHQSSEATNLEMKHDTGPEVIKLVSCSPQLSTKFQLLIKAKVQTNKEVACFQSLRGYIYHANKCENANNCWHLQDKSRVQLS